MYCTWYSTTSVSSSPLPVIIRVNYTVKQSLELQLHTYSYITTTNIYKRGFRLFAQARSMQSGTCGVRSRRRVTPTSGRRPRSAGAGRTEIGPSAAILLAAYVRRPASGFPLASRTRSLQLTLHF